MYSIKLKLTGKHTTDSEFYWILNYYLSSLYGSRQILNEEWEIEQLDDGYCVMLRSFEKDSYLEENSIIYANRWRHLMESEHGFKLEFSNCGIHPVYGEVELAKDYDALVLDIHNHSPLSALATLFPVPFYKIPPTYHDGKEYHNLISWAGAYEKILGIWFGSVGERWAQNQLQKADSALSREGRAVCKRIEELTGTPTYYFLFNSRSISKKKDQMRKCPGCGGDWLLENTSPKYPFQCRPCRLVSEFSSSS